MSRHLGRALAAPLRRIAETLVSIDPIEPVDALVLLGGEARSDRSDEAARLFKLVHARYLILGSSMECNTTMKERCVSRGVPGSSIVSATCPRRRCSTRSEAEIGVGLLTGLDCRSFILVTTDYHTARARRAFQRHLRGMGIHMIVHGSHDYYMSLDEWWRSRHGRERIPKEIGKTIACRLIARY